MELIGLNGKKGSGKDTAGAWLVEEHGFERLSFAAPLKESAAACFDIDPSVWETLKNDPDACVTVATRIHGEPGIVGCVTVREFLQRYGTEAHRDIFGADFWTRQLIDRLDPDGKYVVTDARFENECQAIQDAGGAIVVIKRPGTDADDAHASEADLPEKLIDTVLYNHGTIEDLHETLDIYLALASELV
jgi:hypothetical protein